MNTVCPGFMPHHVKPNRCRRCFKDIHDHSTNNEVSTSFTLPLPRRRRESVAVTESPKTEEAAASDQSASFTITETTSLGRRTRQRSSSTSSWFQEKKVNEEQKEKIDSLFRNADDSKASYKSTVISYDDTDDKNVDAVAVIRLPDLKSRRRTTEDNNEASISNRTSDTKLSSYANNRSTTSDSLKSNSENLSSKRFELRSRSARESASKSDDTKPPELPPKTSENKFDLLRKTDTKTPDKKETESKYTSKFGSSRTSDNESTLGRSNSFKSKFESQTSEPLNRSSSFRSRFDTSTTDSKDISSKVEPKVPEKKSWESSIKSR
ncbi:uncharacterized protein NPIL_3911, partial [Nephila pilipes]